jgi:hypothetical protein
MLSLARISHWLSTAAADPGMSTALRSVGLLDVKLLLTGRSADRPRAVYLKDLMIEFTVAEISESFFLSESIFRME